MLGFGTLFFLADLLSSRLCSRLLSQCFVPLRIASLQASRSWAKACHSSTGMLQALRVDFSTSLYRFLCPPLCRLPVESSAGNSCFGSLLSSMRVTCPDQRSYNVFIVSITIDHCFERYIGSKILLYFRPMYQREIHIEICQCVLLFRVTLLNYLF